MKKIFLVLILAVLSNCQEEVNTEVSTSPSASNGLAGLSIAASNVKVKQPEFSIVQPIRRQGSSLSKVNTAPCGGVEKNLADTLTNTGSLINAIWETKTPTGNGNCTVAMSSAMEENFISLRPAGIGAVYNSDFSFACGRQEGFEFQEFELPADYACDQCTLQFSWNTPSGTYYSCSDMMIIGNKGI